MEVTEQYVYKGLKQLRRLVYGADPMTLSLKETAREDRLTRRKAYDPILCCPFGNVISAIYTRTISFRSINAHHRRNKTWTMLR